MSSGENPEGGPGVADTLYKRLTGTALLDVLNVKSKPAPDVLMQRVQQLKAEVLKVLAAVPEGDPARAQVVQRLGDIEKLVDDPLEWHILVRAHAMRLDPQDPDVKKRLEAAFLETHVPRAVWLNAPNALEHQELRRAVRLPLLADVDVEVAANNIVPLRTENLSRTGLCLCEVPAGFHPSTVKLHIQLPGETKKLALTGKVAWKRQDRLGIAFVDASAADEIMLDKALQGHFAAVRALAERYLALAPTDPTAQSCVAMARYFSTVLPNERAAAVDQLVAQATEHRQAFEMQLACARLCLEAGDVANASKAMRRVEKGAQNDPRYAQLEELLAKKSGAARRIVRAVQRQSVLTQAIGVATVLIGLGASTTWALMSSRGVYEEVALPPQALPCQQTFYANTIIRCVMDVNAWNAIPEAERMDRVEKTLSALAGKGAKNLRVVRPDAGEIFSYGELFPR